MATRRTKAKPTAADSSGNADPTAPLSSDALLAAARPVLDLLAADLLARAKASPTVTAALAARHAEDQKEERTADPFTLWQANLVDQVAAAWLLSCVFVRTLEDRGLLQQARLAGPGAADSQRQFFDSWPSLAERDYLLTVFRELSNFPAARDLFDAKHNSVWLLTPSAEAAKALLALFRLPSAEAPTFRFGQADSRFLGDLYQDLNEAVRKRYGLWQTPRFVEAFILDRTLEPAIERFGLDETTVIDPTCGSGHLLLGAFDRLFEHRLRAEPDLGVREAAHKALGAVYGADINPYAVAIARFRLTLAYLEKAQVKRLAEVRALSLHFVVADSLYHNATLKQGSFVDIEGQSADAWGGDEFALEDKAAAREILHRQFAAVVGNPPYITEKDPVLRERYREMYESAAGKYSLAAPFAQRFFQLAREGGRVGMITANSFMKREFGKKLIEHYLPTVNLDLIVNTSGAYIPGHGTPTVLLFGTGEAARGTDVLTVLAKRGEPTTPEVAEQGLAWRSIAEHWDEVGFENDFVSVARIERTTLAKHPWSLGGGGAAELKDLLEERAENRLRNLIQDIGFASFTGLDDAFILPAHVAKTMALAADIVRPMVLGECVRDWEIAVSQVAIAPYDLRTQRPLPLDVQSSWCKHLWRFRTVASNVASFGGKTRAEEGQSWWQWYRWQAERYLSSFRLTFAFVATHNHFVIDRGGRVFKQTAPIITLPDLATEDDHLGLLAYLNSSTVCFWMKQTMMNKGGSGIGRGVQDEGWEARFEFDSTKLSSLPVPPNVDALIPLARDLLALVRVRESLVPDRYVREAHEKNNSSPDGFAKLEAEDRRLLGEMVCLQERIDFEVYRLFGLIDRAPEIQAIVHPGSRFFEVAMIRQATHTTWFERHDYARPDPTLPALQDFHLSSEVLLMEQPDFKRRWTHRDWTAEIQAARDTVALEQLESYIAARVEVFSGAQVVRYTVRGAWGGDTLVSEDGEPALVHLIHLESVPYLAALRYTDAGMDNRAEWEKTWDVQRSEDRGEKVPPFDPPPKYDPKDYRDPTYWRLRGKLDVPKERFISYPGCESDQDGEPVYGWAGWNHLQQAQALAALYQKRKTEEAWEKDRLTPMLAGLLELLPWIQQWHNEPSDDYAGMRLGDFFASFLEAECISLGLTRDDLRNWRPEAKKRGKAAPQPRKAAAEPADTDADPADLPAPPPASEAPDATRPPAARKPRETRRKTTTPEPAPDE